MSCSRTQHRSWGESNPQALDQESHTLPTELLVHTIAQHYITENSNGGKDPNIRTLTLTLHCGDKLFPCSLASLSTTLPQRWRGTGQWLQMTDAKLLYYLSRIMRKPTFWFPTWSDTNQAVQLQKIARGLKFRI